MQAAKADLPGGNDCLHSVEDCECFWKRRYICSLQFILPPPISG
jgi:hypothetical protein